MTAMTTFWLLAAALTAVTMAALLIPLMRRPRPAAGATKGSRPTERAEMVRWYQEQLREIDADLRAGTLDAASHARVRAELGQRLLDDTDDAASTAPAALRTDRRPALLGALLLAALPTAAVVLYQHLGNPTALWTSKDVTASVHHDQAIGEAQIDSMVNSLAQRLRAAPNDPAGWSLLARSYTALERHEDAAEAYAKAVALAPDVAALHADYADALATLQDGKLNGGPMEQIKLALKLDPDEPKALALAATAAAERGDVDGAITHWEHLARLMPPDSAAAKQVAANLAAARAARQKASGSAK